MMDENRRNKIHSKYFRLELSDDLRKVIKILVDGGIQELTETQIGNHIYSGHGKIEIDGKLTPVTVRVQMIDERPLLAITAPGKSFKVFSPLNPSEAQERLRRAKEKLLN
jgi:hypothetical protein